ncbi:MAG: hypothetical protein RR275_05205 [Lachnospiraceae bacterium]
MSMAAQTSYGFGFPKGVAGGLFDLSHHEVVTRQAEGTVHFGVGVVIGTNAGTDVAVPTSDSTASDFEGVVVHNSVMVELDMKNNLNIEDKRTVGCLNKGKLWVALAPGAVPSYKQAAYLVKDGDYAGCFTSQSGAYSIYCKCKSTDTGANKIIADTATPGTNEVKLSAVTPVEAGYTPAVNDYVLSKQIYGAPLNVGAKFGTADDSDNGIAVIEL